MYINNIILCLFAAAIDNISNVQSGDAIVCFKKSDIYKVSQQLERTKNSPAVIYGSLPAGSPLTNFYFGTKQKRSVVNYRYMFLL